jgi:hypothetical protein
MESGGPINYNTYFVEAHYQPTYDTLVNLTGCATAIDTLDCVRHAPFDIINDFFLTRRTEVIGTLLLFWMEI